MDKTGDDNMRHDEDYYEHRLMCPHCNSTNLEYEEYDWDDDIKWEKYTCLDCSTVAEFAFYLQDAPARVQWEDPEPPTHPDILAPPPITFPDTPTGRLQSQAVQLQFNIRSLQNELDLKLMAIEKELPRNSAKLPKHKIQQILTRNREKLLEEYHEKISKLEKELTDTEQQSMKQALAEHEAAARARIEELVRINEPAMMEMASPVVHRVEITPYLDAPDERTPVLHPNARISTIYENLL